VLKLKRECDSFGLQEKEDRRRIMELLALNNSVEQDITYFKDCRPEKLQRFPLKANPGHSNLGLDKRDPESDISLPRNKDSIRKGKTMGTTGGVGGKTVGKKKVGPTATGARSILRTVYIPNEQINTLQVEIEQLRAQNAEQVTNNH
jgi:hypothetical protein